MSDKFFIVVPLGFEPLAAAELAEKFPQIQNAIIEKGGITVECTRALGFSLNYLLKIPSAVLLRIAEFKCRDFPKLFQKTSNLRWGRFLQGGLFELSVASSKSRLLNEKKIAETVSEGIRRHFEKQPFKKVSEPYKFEILVRLHNDVCTFSINTSGELLFKRGYKSMVGVAPIRENLAAGLYYALKQSGASMECLVDPMCGTGTLLFESALFYSSSRDRAYAFENYYDGLLGETQEPVQVTCRKFIGWDKSHQALNLAQENSRKIQSKIPGCEMQFVAGDLMNESIEIPPHSVVVCNPPYNERLKIKGSPEGFYSEMIEKIISTKPEVLGIIIPHKYSSFVIDKKSPYKVYQEIRFSNGGIPVVFKIFRNQVRAK